MSGQEKYLNEYHAAHDNSSLLLLRWLNNQLIACHSFLIIQFQHHSKSPGNKMEYTAILPQYIFIPVYSWIRCETPQDQ